MVQSVIPLAVAMLAFGAGVALLGLGIPICNAILVK